jgi:hypothetical protein
VPRTGRYIVAIQNGSATLTPTIRRPRANHGRRVGGCDPTTAPSIPSGVLQVGHTRFCGATGGDQLWRLALRRGDTLELQAQVWNDGGEQASVYPPDARSVSAKPLCSGYVTNGPGPLPSRLACRIHHSGGYLIGFHSAGVFFTPLAVHPTRLTLRVPASVHAGARLTARIHIASNAAKPAGTCFLDRRSGGRWHQLGHTTAKAGGCTIHVVLAHRGTARLRARFRGSRGWASSTSAPRNVTVT